MGDKYRWTSTNIYFFFFFFFHFLKLDIPKRPQNISLWTTALYKQCVCFAVAVYFIYCSAQHIFGLEKSDGAPGGGLLVLQVHMFKIIFISHCITSSDTVLYHSPLLGLACQRQADGEIMRRETGLLLHKQKERKRKRKNSRNKTSIELFLSRDIRPAR